jgi:uncharacterized membrane protein YqaE (UPF0057 family)
VLFVLGVVLPPVAVLLSGKKSEVRLNILLTCLFWVPGVIHALSIVRQVVADERKRSLTRALEEIALLTPRNTVTHEFERAEGEPSWKKLLGTN